MECLSRRASLPAKVVDLEPCLKKPVEDSACHPYNTRGSMSEVQSLSSFQSESCDDNGKPFSKIRFFFPLIRYSLNTTWSFFLLYSIACTHYIKHKDVGGFLFSLPSEMPVRFLQRGVLSLCQSDLFGSTLTPLSLSHAENGPPIGGCRVTCSSLSFSIRCGVSAPIWIKSVHRSRTRF